jgi:hypothetical protein
MELQCTVWLRNVFSAMSSGGDKVKMNISILQELPLKRNAQPLEITTTQNATKITEHGGLS